jgi:hypothetical protein
MAEESETPNGGQGGGAEGRARRGEGDLFSERRARRAAESGEAALTRRAEAAEATVQTLERHVASLQQRLREAEDERARMDELIEAERLRMEGLAEGERAAALEREHELRRVKQREYAEQQLRVEAEDRLLALERDGGIEIERLGERLDASERDARELTLRLEGVQRQLAEAHGSALAGEQAAGAERSARVVPAELRADDLPSVAEQAVQARLTELERRALEIQLGLDAERVARERSERLLDGMREGHRRMEALLGEMKGIVSRVSVALMASEQVAPAEVPAGQGAEMAEALASAVERLRARAASSPEGEITPPVAEEAAEGTSEEAVGGTVEQSAVAVEETVAPVPQLPTYKHSMSWFARQRIRRKQRRAR